MKTKKNKNQKTTYKGVPDTFQSGPSENAESHEDKGNSNAEKKLRRDTVRFMKKA